MNRQTVVVLEGPDGTGKTTLANALVERGWAYGHCGPPEKPALEFYLDGIREALTAGKPVVMDRLHVGSYAYGKVFRHADDLTDFERWLIEGTLWAHNGMLVYTNAPQTAADAFLDGRGPDNADAAVYEQADKRAAVRERYEEYMRGINQMRVCHYDYTCQGALEDIVNELNFDAQMWGSDGPAWLKPYVPALGNLRSPWLFLVGDAPSGRARALQRAKKNGLNTERYMQLLDVEARWAPPFGSGCGPYLRLALTTQRLGLRDYCVFNSTLFDGRTLADNVDIAEWKTRRRVVGGEVVAMGMNAHAQLDALGMPHRTVPHPQHVKRFHYKRVADYGKAITGEKPWVCDTDYCGRRAW